MAQELLIGRSGYRVKLRSPWAVALLPFITLGIYHLVWWYRINRENARSRRRPRRRTQAEPDRTRCSRCSPAA